jgi:hypothetical protein
MLTLAEIREEVSPFVGDSGTNPSSDDIRIAINRARRVLYELGDWKGMSQDIRIQAYKGTITLPPAFDFINKAYFAVKKITIPNEWFYITTGAFDSQCGSSVEPSRMNEPVGAFRDFTMVNTSDQWYRAAVMFESDREEADTKVTIHAYNKQGGRVSLTRKYGTGFLDVTSNPPNDFYLNSIHSVTKGPTKGRVLLYGYIPDTNKRVLMAIWEQGDINPSLTRYHVATAGCDSQFMVRAKKRYMPIVNESDLVDIHVEALIHTLQALTDRGTKNIAGYNTNMSLAVQFLNREIGQVEASEQGMIKTGWQIDLPLNG